VRTLFSRNGGRTLQPSWALATSASMPLQSMLAVRRFNYWAERLCVAVAHDQSRRQQSPRRVAAARSAIKAGAPTQDVGGLIARRCP